MDNKTGNMTEGGGHGALAGIKDAAGLAYRTLASTRTSAFILCSMALLFLAVAVFQQGGGLEENILDGESLVFFAPAPGLSQLFSSPLFLALYFALFVNLAFATYNIVQAIRSSGKEPLEVFTPTHSISLTQNAGEAATDARRALEGGLGLRVITPGGDWVVMERGLPYRYLIWAHHAGTAICIVSIALTILFAFDQTVTLTQGKAVAIEPAARGRVAFLNTRQDNPSGLRLVSGPFTARYTEKAAGADPDSLLSKLAASLGHERPAYEMIAGVLYPVDWKLDITVVEDGIGVMKKAMGPGGPLRYGNFTFYLQDLDQTFRLRVEDNPLMLSVRNNDELFIPGLGLPVRFSIFRRGTLKKTDDSVERVSPHTRMKLSGGSGMGEDLGRIGPGESIYINGARLTLVDVVDSPGLAYSYDPGFRLLRWGGLIVLATMALRLLGPFQMAAYRVDYSAPVVRLHLHIVSRGAFASSNRLFKRLERIMTANDIRPIPLPGGRLK